MFTGTVDINAGAIDNTTIGATTESTGAFTSLSASGAATFNGDVTLGDAVAYTIVFTGTVHINAGAIANNNHWCDYGEHWCSYHALGQWCSHLHW
mmetsp:Transcript_64605/g.210705  ORF Transcript_64605/g.210705 Transcript_64605/m.210705 type:complete len:95 (+) Transcript_64605:896-1180(+)